MLNLELRVGENSRFNDEKNGALLTRAVTYLINGDHIGGHTGYKERYKEKIKLNED